MPANPFNANSEIDETTAELSSFIKDTSFDDIPDDVLEREKWHVLDTLGCILYGSATPWVAKLIRALEEIESSGNASVLGTGEAVSPARACLINGTAAHSMDYDDTNREGGIHAGANTIPNAIAYSEVADRTVTGREFITAVTIGVETGIRSGMGIGFEAAHRGFHIAGYTGPFASAATTGKLLGLTHEELANALGLAGTQGSGLNGAQYGAEVKRYHPGRAAESGYLAALYAKHEFTGDTKIFANRYGSIATVFSDNYDVEAMTDGIGDHYYILDKLTLKTFPSIGMVHRAVAGIRDIVDEEKLTLGDIDSVLVEGVQHTVDHVGWDYEPTSVMAAQANMQYGIATLLVDGEVTMDAFTEDSIDRPEVLDRITDIEVRVDEELEAENPEWFGSVVTVETRDGNRYTQRSNYRRGAPEKPMPKDEILAKFRNQASEVISDDKIERIIEFTMTIEDQNDTSQLLQYLV